MEITFRLVLGLEWESEGGRGFRIANAPKKLARFGEFGTDIAWSSKMGFPRRKIAAPTDPFFRSGAVTLKLVDRIKSHCFRLRISAREIDPAVNPTVVKTENLRIRLWHIVDDKIFSVHAIMVGVSRIHVSHFRLPGTQDAIDSVLTTAPLERGLRASQCCGKRVKFACSLCGAGFCSGACAKPHLKNCGK